MAKILVSNGKVVKSENVTKKEKVKFSFRVGYKSFLHVIDIYAYTEKQARYFLIEKAKKDQLYIPYIELITEIKEETTKQEIEKLLNEYDEYDQAFCECSQGSDTRYYYGDLMHKIDMRLKQLGYTNE